MISTVDSTTSFKALYFTNGKFSKKQKKICKDIENKLGDRVKKYDYLLEPGLNGSVNFYTYNFKDDKAGYFGSYNNTTEYFDDSALKNLDNSHKTHLGLSLAMAAFLTLSMGVMFAMIGKHTKYANTKPQTEIKNNINTLIEDTLNLSKKFVK